MDRVDVLADWIDEQAGAYHASGSYALFSGGDDSLATALVATKAKTFRACVHIDTGIGIPETQAFVRETCRAQGWPLLVYRALDQGQDYEHLAVTHGFPGPAAHWRMYVRLKERALRAFVREHKIGRTDRLVLVTGARSGESQRRMGYVQPLRKDGAKVWVNPLHDWSKLDCLDWILSTGVPRNPVVELLHMSGECLCGAFAAPGELKEITLWYPEVGARIQALETRVRASGQVACQWGSRPPGPRSKRKVSELCQGCEVR